MSQTQTVKQSNSHLRSLLNVKYLLNDMEDTVLLSCIQTLFDSFGSKRDILEILIKYSSKKQLDTMTNIIEDAIANSNEIGNKDHVPQNFEAISNLSIVNIISFLTKNDINELKLTSIRLGILCLQVMDTKSDGFINGKYSKYKPNVNYTQQCLYSLNQRGLWIEKWRKHIADLSINGQNYALQASAIKCDFNNPSNIKQCGCIQRLLIIFSYVNQSSVDDVDSIIQIFAHFDGYSVQDFINDLDHIRIHHDKQVNEQLFCTEIGHCDWQNCQLCSTLLQNNFEQRDSITNRTRELFVNNKIDDDTFVRFQFIQEAHLYLFHSVPIISENVEYNEILKLMKQYNDNNIERSSRFIDIYQDDNNNNNETPKSPSTISMDSDEIETPKPLENDDNIEDETDYKEEEEDEDTDKGSEKVKSPLFSYGNRFEYNPFQDYKKNPYYVGCTYENLKKELLDDNDKKFDAKDWNALIKCSTKLVELPYSKRLISRKTNNCGYDLSDNNNNNNNKCISIGRILSVRLYCSHGILANALKKTYQESRNKDSKSKQKKEHSRFAHWSRLLSTTCNTFGVDVSDKHKFYRGLNDRFIFTSGFSSKLYGPISTTRHLGVAVAFAGKGIILQIEKASCCNRAIFFECNPYSTYKSEGELLFHGHYNYLDITGVKTNMGFKSFDTKSMLLLQALTTKCNINISILIHLTPSITKTLSDLLKKYKENDNNDNKINGDYLFETITFYLTHLKKLNVRIKQIEDLMNVCKEINQMNECKELLSYLIDDVNDEKSFSIDLYKLIKIFPNAYSVKYDMSRSMMKLNENINSWSNFVKYMNTNFLRGNNKKFHRIEFRKLTKKGFPNKTFLIQMKIKSKWHIYTGINIQNNDQRALLFLYGTNITNHKKQSKQEIIWTELKHN